MKERPFNSPLGICWIYLWLALTTACASAPRYLFSESLDSAEETALLNKFAGVYDVSLERGNILRPMRASAGARLVIGQHSQLILADGTYNRLELKAAVPMGNESLSENAKTLVFEGYRVRSDGDGADLLTLTRYRSESVGEQFQVSGRWTDRRKKRTSIQGTCSPSTKSRASRASRYQRRRDSRILPGTGAAAPLEDEKAFVAEIAAKLNEDPREVVKPRAPKDFPGLVGAVNTYQFDSRRPIIFLVRMPASGYDLMVTAPGCFIQPVPTFSGNGVVAFVCAGQDAKGDLALTLVPDGKVDAPPVAGDLGTLSVYGFAGKERPKVAYQPKQQPLRPARGEYDDDEGLSNLVKAAAAIAIGAAAIDLMTPDKPEGRAPKSASPARSNKPYGDYSTCIDCSLPRGLGVDPHCLCY